MPEFDYECKSCKQPFTVTLSMTEHSEKAKQREIRCPKCGSADVKHRIEPFFVTTERKS